MQADYMHIIRFLLHGRELVPQTPGRHGAALCRSKQEGEIQNLQQRQFAFLARDVGHAHIHHAGTHGIVNIRFSADSIGIVVFNDHAPVGAAVDLLSPGFHAAFYGRMLVHEYAGKRQRDGLVRGTGRRPGQAGHEQQSRKRGNETTALHDISSGGRNRTRPGNMPQAFLFLKKQKACHWACLKKNIYIQYNMYNPFFFPLLPRSNPGLPFIHSISA